jgi:hypothetical protein
VRRRRKGKRGRRRRQSGNAAGREGKQKHIVQYNDPVRRARLLLVCLAHSSTRRLFVQKRKENVVLFFEHEVFFLKLAFPLTVTAECFPVICAIVEIIGIFDNGANYEKRNFTASD